MTGSSGLLGRHIASALIDAGHDVLGIDAVAPAVAAWDHVTADLTELGTALQLIRGAGAVIHACHHEQDIWKMGGLRRKMPITFWTFLIGTAALIAVPGTSGFWSKEKMK